MLPSEHSRLLTRANSSFFKATISSPTPLSSHFFLTRWLHFKHHLEVRCHPERNSVWNSLVSTHVNLWTFLPLKLSDPLPSLASDRAFVLPIKSWALSSELNPGSPLSLSEILVTSPFGIISSVQWLSRVWLFVTPWTAAHQASLSITNCRSLTQTHVHWVGDAIQPSHPLLSPSPPTLNLSQHQGLFTWVSSLH